ncbi:MAG: hypothetical protein ACK4SN_14120, partial [Bellilinea sp.]
MKVEFLENRNGLIRKANGYHQKGADQRAIRAGRNLPARMDQNVRFSKRREYRRFTAHFVRRSVRSRQADHVRRREAVLGRAV